MNDRHWYVTYDGRTETISAASPGKAKAAWLARRADLGISFTDLRVKAAKTGPDDRPFLSGARPDPERVAEHWNGQHPIGQRVRFWSGARTLNGGQVSRTRTCAQVLGGHTAVVWVADHCACIALSHIEALEEDAA